MQRLTKVLTLLAVFSLLLAGNAPAAVTTVGLWQLGDDDPGAVAGGTGNATSVAAVNSPTLDLSVLVGTPTYSSDTAGAASALSMDFDLGDYYRTGGTVATTANNNFGIEAWVNRDSLSGTQGIAWNGNSGWGLYTNGTDILGHLNGSGDVGTGGDTVSTGTWFNVAMVRDNGTSTLYLNGIPNGTTSTGTPSTPSGSVFVGQIGGAPGAFNSDGKMDHVRVFTFAPGEFNPATDLTLSLAGGTAVIFIEDFESPVGDAWQIQSGAMTFDNPVTTAHNGGPWAGRMQQTENGLNPFSGNQFYEMNGSSTLDSSILFEVAAANTLANGTNLTVSLYSASLFSDTVDETFDVILSGGAVGTQSDIADSDPRVWQQHTFQFTVTDSTQAIDLEILATRDSTTAEDLLIDRITVEAAVPEPSTFALTAIGLLGLTLIGRRRRK